MIDIKELAIGDWVRHSFYEEDMRINSIDENGKIHAGANRLSVCCHIDNFEPIPITPEILEKNGFVSLEKDHLCWMLNLNGVRVFVSLYDAGTARLSLKLPCTIGFDPGSVSVINFAPIQAIHELQHTLIRLGKDIVL